MTQLRQKILEELSPRDFSADTIRRYIHLAEKSAGYFWRRPDQPRLRETRSTISLKMP